VAAVGRDAHFGIGKGGQKQRYPPGREQMEILFSEILDSFFEKGHPDEKGSK
jgi:hypothetical protein